MKTLIAAKNEGICSVVAEMLSDGRGECVCFTSGEEVRRENPADFGLIVISTPLSDEFGLDLCAYLHRRTDAAVVVLTKGEIADEVSRKIRFTGAAVVGRPVSGSTLRQAVKNAEIRRAGGETENARPENTDDAVVGKAKACLMQYLKLSEEQAHRHIQKQAMDLRTSRRQVAEDILKMYGGATL